MNRITKIVTSITASATLGLGITVGAGIYEPAPAAAAARSVESSHLSNAKVRVWNESKIWPDADSEVLSPGERTSYRFGKVYSFDQFAHTRVRIYCTSWHLVWKCFDWANKTDKTRYIPMFPSGKFAPLAPMQEIAVFRVDKV